jgi:hypothetical protein
VYSPQSCGAGEEEYVYEKNIDRKMFKKSIKETRKKKVYKPERPPYEENAGEDDSRKIEKHLLNFRGLIYVVSTVRRHPSLMNGEI